MLTVIVVGIIIYIIYLYNSLISNKNKVENVFSSVDVMLKKRYDLIPNLVSSVQVYMKHEKELMEEITKIRTKATSDNVTEQEKIELDKAIAPMLSTLSIAMEDYPDLKANENVLQFQRTLNDIEAQISAARRSYNQAVNQFNNSVEMFPSSIMANAMKYTRKESFVIVEAERKNVDVKNLFDK